MPDRVIALISTFLHSYPHSIAYLLVSYLYRNRNLSALLDVEFDLFDLLCFILYFFISLCTHQFLHINLDNIYCTCAFEKCPVAWLEIWTKYCEI